MHNRSSADHDEIAPEDVLALAGKPASELTFGERLNLLWMAVRPLKDEDPQAWRKASADQRRSSSGDTDSQGRPQYTNTWVAQQLDERYGVRITPSYLGKLRHDEKVNPSLPVLLALAKFFKVDTTFLLPATTKADQDKITGVRDNLIEWISTAGISVIDTTNADTVDQNGIAIELRLLGVTTAAEAQRQVALALAQWLEAQHSSEPITLAPQPEAL
ncbi:hypothetical protein CFP75_31810 [Amycolatopsis alba DSM 44262]|uniref:HTH cro/C1-type domain-containing protein n=2 Tax=Amycolatopsis alba TaxID=76020 RepID=A0A229REU8_AMYAL|nr:hypothetical protein CFP75_31810 [Amycolatopsis alba DSM 44262]